MYLRININGVKFCFGLLLIIDDTKQYFGCGLKTLDLISPVGHILKQQTFQNKASHLVWLAVSCVVISGKGCHSCHITALLLSFLSVEV